MGHKASAASPSVAATRRPLRKASTLAGEVYFSPEFHETELGRIFSKMWLVVGCGADLPSPGRLGNLWARADEYL